MQDAGRSSPFRSFPGGESDIEVCYESESHDRRELTAQQSCPSSFSVASLSLSPRLGRHGQKTQAAEQVSWWRETRGSISSVRWDGAGNLQAKIFSTRELVVMLLFVLYSVKWDSPHRVSLVSHFVALNIALIH